MLGKKLAITGVLIAAGLGISACATDGYYGGAYGGYGDYYGYNGGYYDGGGAYYDPSYYGWYDNYYYPGTGVYVYDRAHNRHRWDDRQRSYWQNRGNQWHGQRSDRDNWDRFDHRPAPRGNNGGNDRGHWNGDRDRGGHWGGDRDHDGDHRGHRR
jgi:hypothetical protein